jgi:hypothetical protein
MKLLQSLNIIENKLDKESGSSKSGSHRPLMRKEEQEVLADITTTPRGIPIREHTASQVHPLSGSTRGLGWMSYEEK